MSDVTLRAARDERVTTSEALAFVAALVRAFRPRVDELLARRRERQARFDAGELPDFLPETAALREADWRIAPVPPSLRDRRVEITGPPDRKMVINALNSGASCYMADFEDSLAPTWKNLVDGHVNLQDAVRGTIAFEQAGRRYELGPHPAVLFVRPRGWHLWERHLEVDGRQVPGGLFDFGLFAFHNARAQVARGAVPAFYLPKMQSYLEARLWNDVFAHAEIALGLPDAAFRATVLIETLPAAFEMDEILYELRDRSAGLNCGRWDYIFSFIKTLRYRPEMLLPDRGQVTMDKAFLRAYTTRLVQICHRRGAHAMGGMAAQIPIKSDPAANERALEKVRADKLREVALGHDGTWVAHPGLVPVAKAVFDEHMKGPNQLDVAPAGVITRDDLLRIPEGTRTEAGLRHNVRVGVLYLESWLRGAGCVPLYDLMEDAATAEIARAQVWQWLHHRASLDGSILDVPRFRAILAEEVAKLDGARLAEAVGLFDRLSTADAFEEFLTVPAYDLLD